MRDGQIRMELQERGRAVGGTDGQEGFRGRAHAGCDRPHRTARQQGQRDLRPGFRPCAGRRTRGRRRIGARRAKAAARSPHHCERILQHRRPAHDLGLDAAERFQAGGGRAVDRPGQGGRWRHPRQDQRPRGLGGLAELQRDLRHDEQSVRSRPHAGWLVGRLVCGARGRLRTTLAWVRHRRLVARARLPLRGLCA
ncbi:hypothetical protein ACVWXL_008566 [Bradyrhizobium sp. GM22.5]